MGSYDYSHSTDSSSKKGLTPLCISGLVTWSSQDSNWHRLDFALQVLPCSFATVSATLAAQPQTHLGTSPTSGPSSEIAASPGSELFLTQLFLHGLTHCYPNPTSKLLSHR